MKCRFSTREINGFKILASSTFERLEIANKSHQVKNITLPIFHAIV